MEVILKKSVKPDFAVEEFCFVCPSCGSGQVSVTEGVVSRLETGTYAHSQSIQHLLVQTDAAINPGNSGGPLANMRGEVIGVNARVLSGAENVGFAIPVDTAREVVEAIIQDGKVHRSYLGLTLQEMFAKTDDPTQHGVVIADVAPLSPAHESGVHPGDILVAVNGEPVNARYNEDLPAVRKQIADLPVGEKAKLGLVRGEEPLEFAV